MKPSNPGSYFVNGSTTVEFTYEPGQHAYYAVVHGKSWIPVSALLFANDEAHVRDILRQLIAFGELAEKAYANYRKRQNLGPRGESQIGRLVALKKALDGSGELQLRIGLAERGQLYKIGWASNDTF